MVRNPAFPKSRVSSWPKTSDLGSYRTSVDEFARVRGRKSHDSRCETSQTVRGIARQLWTAWQNRAAAEMLASVSFATTKTLVCIHQALVVRLSPTPLPPLVGGVFDGPSRLLLRSVSASDPPCRPSGFASWFGQRSGMRQTWPRQAMLGARPPRKFDHCRGLRLLCTVDIWSAVSPANTPFGFTEIRVAGLGRGESHRHQTKLASNDSSTLPREDEIAWEALIYANRADCLSSASPASLGYSAQKSYQILDSVPSQVYHLPHLYKSAQLVWFRCHEVWHINSRASFERRSEARESRS